MKKLLSTALIALFLLTACESANPDKTSAPTYAAEVTLPPAEPDTLRFAYEPIFGYMGNAAGSDLLADSATLEFVKKHYNCLTPGNEFKPDSLLRATFIKKERAKELGYYIPDGYAEEKFPTINFDRIDNFLKIAAENGFKVRFHTLLWHNQTPEWFFKQNYYYKSENYVSPEIMDKREEMYIKSLVKHVYENPNGGLVYAWDVVNEYLTSGGQGGWNKVFGSDDSYVLKAFKYAGDMLAELGVRDKVGLFYNDYNTYEVSTKIINLIKEINTNGKYCDGVGMQSHLDVGYPTVESIGETIDKFAAEGYEIQITELDVTLNGEYYHGDKKTEEEQTAFYGDLFKMLIEKKKGGANITAVVFWGLSDSGSWRKKYTPLIFKTIGKPKLSYFAVIDAAKQ